MKTILRLHLGDRKIACRLVETQVVSGLKGERAGQVVLDLYARKVVGWSMRASLSRELVLDALLMAVWRRKPGRSVLVHSDQGCQFGSDDFRRFCRAQNLEPSMSRRDNCRDNAVAESFFSSLKKERIRKRIYKACDLARADVLDYIEVFYNRARRAIVSKRCPHISMRFCDPMPSRHRSNECVAALRSHSCHSRHETHRVAASDDAMLEKPAMAA